MRQSSSSPSSSSFIPPASSSFYERYEKMFHCGGCIADDEQEPVASAILYQQSSDERDEQQSTQSNEAISNCNWSSFTNKARRRHQQESAPLDGTVLLNQASFDEIDKLDIEERTSKRQQSKTQAAKAKAQTEATAVNEYFNGIRNSHQTELQMAIQRSPTTIMTQQQRREQQCHVTPIKSNKTVIPTSKQPLSSPKTRLQQYDMFQVVMPRSFRSSLTGPDRQHRYNGGGSSLKDTLDSDSTQSTQSLSESDDDLSWGLEENEEQQPPLQEQDTPVVSILRSKFQFETRTETKRTEKNRVRRVVRFEQETKFPDHTEGPSSTRKQVPRMSPQQKQEYMYMSMMMHTSYPPTTTDRRQRQWEVSSLLMEPAAAVGPSPLVRTPTPNNQDEFRDSSLTATKHSLMNMNMMCSSSSHPERLARRAQQNQYHHPHHQHQRSHSSTSEELLLSHYYTTNQKNEELASYSAFQ